MKNVIAELLDVLYKNKTKLKGEKGITLIALIITIIILIILAAVSIRAAYNSGIIDYSINGTQKYQEEAKKEESVLSNTESFMASILSRLGELDNEDNGNNDVPDLLRKYVLGANERGRNLLDILDYYGNDDGAFYNDPNSITDAHETVIYLNELMGDYKESSSGFLMEDPEEISGLIYIYIKYDNVGYKIVVNYENSVYSSDVFITTDVIKVYEPSGDEGEIVEYSVDGTSSATDWLVLYDNGTTVDITPVELDEEWVYTFGYQDPAAAVALPSGTNLERAIWSYNNAVDTLNDYCIDEIVTNSTAQAVRSIGTGFGITDTSTMYSSDFLEENPLGQEGEYNGLGKVGDLNAEQDVVRMSYFSPGNSYETFGYANTGDYYWLASRKVREGINYCIRDGIQGMTEWYEMGWSSYVRAVNSLRKNV